MATGIEDRYRAPGARLADAAGEPPVLDRLPPGGCGLPVHRSAGQRRLCIQRNLLALVPEPALFQPPGDGVEGADQPLERAFAERVASPLGMEDFVPDRDVFRHLEPSVSRWDALLFRLSARDLARLSHESGRQIGLLISRR